MVDQHTAKLARNKAIERIESGPRVPGDPEGAHSEADEAVLECLEALGAGDVAAAWRRLDDELGFWYA